MMYRSVETGLKRPHRCSIGLISRDWFGHESFVIPFSLNRSWVARAMWQGASSSINRVSFLLIWPLENIGMSSSRNIETYLGEVRSLPPPPNDHHSILHPDHYLQKKIPCFTVGCSQLLDEAFLHSLPSSSNCTITLLTVDRGNERFSVTKTTFILTYDSYSQKIWQF